MPSAPLFRSFFSGGFECSTHRRPDGRRLDMVAATAHDRHVAADYRRLRENGIRTAREGIRWHLTERSPGRYDFSSVLPQVRAARDAGLQVIWDVCHYGWPDDLDPFGAEFARRLGQLAGAFTRLLVEEGESVPFLAPINEISFLTWAGGEMGYLNPFGVRRGDELKRRLVRATIAAIDAIRNVAPGARICHVDPVFHAIADESRPHEASAAEECRQLQYEAWDMLAGRQQPHLGGRPDYLDVIGVNYYPWNQWIFVNRREAGPTLQRTHPRYRPFRELLAEVGERYGRPLFVAETGTEGDARAEWLRYVGDETRAALDAGVDVHGICLYPIVNFPGWDNDRHCHNGLWDYADDRGERAIYRPLATELRRQIQLFEDRQSSSLRTA